MEELLDIYISFSPFYIDTIINFILFCYTCRKFSNIYFIITYFTKFWLGEHNGKYIIKSSI